MIKAIYRKTRKLWEGKLSGFLIRSASGSFVVKVLGAALAFGIQILLARLLGAEDYGIFRYVWSWASLLVLFGTFGFKGGLVRLVSKFTKDERWEDLQGVLRHSFLFVLLLSSGLGLCVTIVAYSVAEWGVSPDLNYNLAIGAVLLPLLGVLYLSKSALRAFKQVVRADIPHQILRRIFLGCFVTAGYLLLGSVDATYAVISASIAVLLSASVALVWVWNALPDEVLNCSPTFHRKEWTQFSFPFLLISGAAIIQERADVIMLGALDVSQSVGIYAAATRVTAVISFGLGASNMIVAPLISEMYSDGNREQLQKMIAYSSSAVFLYAAPVSCILMLYGERVLRLFGEEFTEGYSAMVIVALGLTASSLAGPVGHVAAMTDYQWKTSQALGVAAVANIVLNYLFIPRFGIEGAAMATAASDVVWNLILLVFIWRKLRVNTTVLSIFQIKK